MPVDLLGRDIKRSFLREMENNIGQKLRSTERKNLGEEISEGKIKLYFYS